MTAYPLHSASYFLGGAYDSKTNTCGPLHSISYFFGGAYDSKANTCGPFVRTVNLQKHISNLLLSHHISPRLFVLIASSGVESNTSRHVCQYTLASQSS
ncbi:hypothetical protein PCASD_15614 [Puccinia coronata f. sp. avenae]|uniref:Uncharacterized protein n=1 Tax=Puccinia coronata f. sp. avenae TaxID=200324 RepID=A0A2N5TY82_9BASI|nr:hypothetical protein PCASD_15614 [Puccinia coronata f. sp. avenae]